MDAIYLGGYRSKGGAAFISLFNDRFYARDVKVWRVTSDAIKVFF